MEDWDSRFQQLQSLLGSPPFPSSAVEHSQPDEELHTPTRPPPRPNLKEHEPSKMKAALNAIEQATAMAASEDKPQPLTNGHGRISDTEGHRSSPASPEGAENGTTASPSATESPSSTSERQQLNTEDPIESAAAFTERLKQENAHPTRSTPEPSTTATKEEKEGKREEIMEKEKAEKVGEDNARDTSHHVSSEAAIANHSLSHFDLKSQLEGVAAAAANQEGLPGVVASVVASAIAGAVSQLDEYKAEVEKLKKENARQQEVIETLQEGTSEAVIRQETPAVSEGEKELYSVLDKSQQSDSANSSTTSVASNGRSKGLLTTTGHSKTIAKEDASDPAWPFSSSLPSHVRDAKEGNIGGLCRELARVGKVAIELRQHNRLLRCIVDALKDEAMRRQQMQQEQISLLKERIAELVEEKEALVHQRPQHQDAAAHGVSDSVPTPPPPPAPAPSPSPSSNNEEAFRGTSPEIAQQQPRHKPAQQQQRNRPKSQPRQQQRRKEQLKPKQPQRRQGEKQAPAAKPWRQGVHPQGRSEDIVPYRQGQQQRRQPQGRSRSLGRSLRSRSRAPSEDSDGDARGPRGSGGPAKARARLLRWKQSNSLSGHPLGRVLSKLRPRSHSAHRSSERALQVQQWNDTARKYLPQDDMIDSAGSVEDQSQRRTPEPARSVPAAMPMPLPSEAHDFSPPRAMPSVDSFFVSAAVKAHSSSWGAAQARQASHVDDADAVHRKGRPWTALGPPLGLGRSAYRNVRSSGYGQRSAPSRGDQPHGAGHSEPAVTPFSPPSRVNQLLEAAGVLPASDAGSSRRSSHDGDARHALVYENVSEAWANVSSTQGDEHDASASFEESERSAQQPRVSSEALKLLSSVQQKVPTPRALSKYNPLHSKRR